jgi:hypothetical protein
MKQILNSFQGKFCVGNFHTTSVKTSQTEVSEEFTTRQGEGGHINNYGPAK